MEEGKTGEAGIRAISKREIMRDIKYLSSKGMISGQEVYYLVKNFLRGYLKLDYEFTKDELFRELKGIYLPYNIRSDFFKFIERLFMFEYANISYSDEELRAFLEEFQGYLDYLFVSNQPKEKTAGQIILRNWKRRIAGLFSRTKGESDEMHEEHPVEADHLDLQVVEGVKAKHVDINSMIEKIYNSIYNSDLESATQIYQEVISLYNELPQEEKLSYYETITSVYNSIKNSSLSS